MDAAQTTKKISSFLAVALLLAGAASAQSLTTSLGPNPTITLNSATGQTQVDVEIRSTDSTTPLSYAVSQDAGWFAVTTQSGTPGVTPSTLRIRLSGTCSLGNTCTPGIITITHSGTDVQTITVNGSNTNTGGGGGSTLLTASTNPVVLSTNTVGGFASVNVNVTTTSVNPVSLITTYTPQNSWLQVFPSSNSVSSGSPITLSIFASAQFLAFNQTYQGSIVVTPNGNSAQALTIPVTFTVGSTTTVTGSLVPFPSTLSFAYPGGVTSASVTVGSTSGTLTYNAATNSENGWLQVNFGYFAAGNVTGSASLFITVNSSAAAALSTGIHNGTVTLTNAANASDITVIPVSLSVNGGTGGGGSAGAAPSSLTFAYQQFKPSPPCQTVVIPNSGTFTITPSGSPLFLFTSASSEFIGPGNVLVCAAVAGLNPGTYSGAITINSTSGFGFSQSIPVTLNVYASPVVTATVNNVSGTVTCNFQSGGGCNDATLTVSASDGSSIPITVAPSATWITVTGSGTSTPSSFVVHLNPATLPNGVTTGSIAITGSGAANATLNVPVVVTVNGSTSGGGGTGNLILGATSLTFTTATSSSQSFSVNAATTTTFNVSTPSNNCGWLSVSPAGSVNTPQTITATVNPFGLTPGQLYTCNISLTSGGNTQTVQVNYTVPTTGGGGTGAVTIDKPSLTFTTQAGVTPATQTLVITSAPGASPVTVSVSANSNGWLSVNPSTGATPLTVTVGVNPAGLTPTSYNGSVNVTPNGGNTITVPVSLNVSAATQVSAVTTPLSFSYVAGTANPATKTIAVTGTGASLPFSAQVTSGAEWLTVTPTTGTTSATVGAATNLTVGVNPGTLTPNQTYNGTIVVAGTGSATGSSTINVSLAITAPLPTITGVTNGASFNTGGIAAGEIITIFGTAMGPSTIQAPPAGTFPTIVSGVQVTVGGYLAPLIYVRNDQIAAIVPYEISRPFIATPTVIVRYLNQGSNGVNVTQVAAAPGIFTTGGGTGQGAILNQNLQPNSAGNPATKGEVIVLYVTGEGQTNPAGVTGKITTVASTAPITPQPVSGLVTVTIDGISSNVQFYGEAPGLVSGVMQINVVVPLGARSGDVPVVVKVGDTSSQLTAQGAGAATVNLR